MEGHDRAALWRDDRWRSARLPATVTGLVLVERVLLDEVGSPAPLLRDLGGIGRSWADPVASVLAVVALMAETLVAYLLIVLLLQSLCSLPGFMGRLAGRLMSRVSPAVVQRLLDLLLGARCSPRWPGDGTRCTARPSMGRLRAGVDRVLGRRRFCRSVHPEWPGHDEPRRGRRRWPLQAMGPAGAGPTPRRSAAPLPPWLGGRAVQRGAQSRRRGWRDRGARAQQQPRHLGSAWASPGAGRPKGCSTATASAWCPRAERPFRILRLPWRSDGASTGRQLFQASPAIPANLHGAGPGVGVPGYMLQPLDISRRRTTRTPSG